jgi:hypothetical protein
MPHHMLKSFFVIVIAGGPLACSMADAAAAPAVRAGPDDRN